MRQMWTREEIKALNKTETNGNETTYNEGLTVNSNGNVEVGKDLTVDGKLVLDSLGSIKDLFPSAAGIYQLKVTVSGDVVTYTWEAVE